MIENLIFPLRALFVHPYASRARTELREFFVNLTSFIIFVLSHLVAKEEQLSCRWVGMHACR